MSEEIRNRPANNPGGNVCERCACVFVGDEWHQFCGICVKKVANELARVKNGESSMEPDEINAGLDALQAAHEKRISGDLQVLEDSDELMALAECIEYGPAAMSEQDARKWASLLRRIAIPRPVGEKE